MLRLALRRAAARAAPREGGMAASAAPAQRRRNMSGLVDKNYYVEEWNGRREITEKTFKFNGKTVPSLLFLALAFPSFIYVVMKDELKKKYKALGYDTKKGGEREQM